MSHPVTIGQSDDGPVKLDVGRLLVSRLLVTSSSGGGKSWMLRKILEQVSLSTQTIVIDPEGEFASLREKRDMVLAGPSGETPAEPRSAALLCRKLMELNLSAVIDISELPPRPRHEFVAYFCNAMVDLPRSLWRPCFVSIDEIHEFAPEGAESACGDAIALLGSKGRKRGYCLLGATQRLSKLSKNVAAELKNLFIGQMVLDVDLKRAADILGFKKESWPDLRDLSPPGREGEFFCFGPALQKRGVIKMRSGMVETSHPKAGEGRIPEPPAPSEKIRGVLDELREIPRQAEQETRDLASARRKIAELEAAARKANLAAAQGQPTSKVAAQLAEARMRHEQDTLAIARLQADMKRLIKGASDIGKTTETIAKSLEAPATNAEMIKAAIQSAVERIIHDIGKGHTRQKAEFEQMRQRLAKNIKQMQEILQAKEYIGAGNHSREGNHSAVKSPTPRESIDAPYVPIASAMELDPEGRAALTPTERDVLDAAAGFPEGATKIRLSIFTGRSIKSSSFTAVFAGGESRGDKPSLVQRGLLKQAGGKYCVTEAGERMARATAAKTLADWMAKLTPSEARVLGCLAKHYPRRLSRAEVSGDTGQSEASSSFTGAFGALKGLELIEGDKDYAVVSSLAEQSN